MILNQQSATRGTTIIEAAVAALAAAVFLASLFTVNLQSMRSIRTAREATSASQILQQRVEAMRIANWQQITNADWVRSNLLNRDAAGSEGLKTLSETLTLTPYGTNGSATQLTRSGGTTQIVQRNSALLTENAMKVVWTVVYNGGMNGQLTTRQAVAVLAKGGVAKW